MTAKRRFQRREQWPPFTTLYADLDEVMMRGKWVQIGREILNGNVQLGTRNDLPVRRMMNEENMKSGGTR